MAVSLMYAAIENPCFEIQVQNEINHIWQLLFLHLSELPSVPCEKNQHTLQIRMQKMLDFIHERFATSVTLGDIAAAADISRSEASRCFQAYRNQSPVSYLLDYRIEKARQLLLSTAETSEAISYKCGFSSSGYFCRVFRKHTGLSPGQYREKQQRRLEVSPPSSAPAASACNRSLCGTAPRNKN